MKFRPQVQLRFRGEGQFDGVKGLASKEGVSVNEWILEQIEKLNPWIAGEEPKKVKAKVK